LERTREAADAKAAGRPLDVGDRIAYKALGEAAFADDPIIADYLGGVLAASGPNDDEGAAIVALISRLSSTQLRVHYIIFREIRRLWPDPSLNLYAAENARRAGVRIRTHELLHAAGEADGDVVGRAIAILWREGLIMDGWQYSREDDINPASHSARVRPTGLGAELFLWGHGTAPIRANRLLDPATELVFLTEVPSTPGSTLLTPPENGG
jgi:hypothetical protein